MSSREPPAHVLEGPPPDRQVAQLRIPPNSIEAEASVLGGLLQDNGAWDRVGDILTDSDFYRYEHQLIFGAVGRLINALKPADVVTVYEQLQRDGKHEEVGGLAYLNSLAQYVPSAANIRRYAEIVRERSILRKLITAADDTAASAFNPGERTVEALLDECTQRMLAVSPDVRGDDWEAMDTGIVRLLDRIQQEADGTLKPDIIPTGLADLDERLDGGGRPGEVIVIGARPSMGKSALGLTIGINAAERGEPVGYWSGEMPKAQLHTRAMAMRSHIHLSRLKRPERLRDFDWPAITRGVDQLRNLPLYINDQASLTITKLRSKVRALKRHRGLRVFVVDHLGLMEPTDPRATRSQQIGDMTRGLKQLAKELGILVILLVQLNREVEKRVDRTPMLSDLRDSGDIEQDADVVVFVHRPYKDKPDLGDEWKYYAKLVVAKLRDSGDIEQDADVVVFVHRPYKDKPDLGDEWKYYAKLVVAKLRDGDPGYVHVMYVGENTNFMNWPEGQQLPASLVRVKKDL